ncbi:MAG: ribosome maturation factor RimM [Hyphomicrobiaceae bacterium]
MPGAAARGGRILLGRIVAAHGVRGEVLVRSYADEPQSIGAYGPLIAPSAGRPIELTVVRVTAKGVIARVAGVNDRNGAEALAGTDLYVDRAKLPAAGEREYYHADLIGLTAVTPEGSEIGRVVGVHNFGAGDLIEVALTASRRTELFPFSDRFVPEVDVAGGRIIIVLPEPSEPDEDGPPQA